MKKGYLWLAMFDLWMISSVKQIKLHLPTISAVNLKRTLYSHVRYMGGILLMVTARKVWRHWGNKMANKASLLFRKTSQAVKLNHWRWLLIYMWGHLQVKDELSLLCQLWAWSVNILNKRCRRISVINQPGKEKRTKVWKWPMMWLYNLETMG